MSSFYHVQFLSGNDEIWRLGDTPLRKTRAGTVFIERPTMNYHSQLTAGIRRNGGNGSSR
jgi:hypothetical protein